MTSPVPNAIEAKTVAESPDTQIYQHIFEKSNVKATATGLSDQPGSDADANSDNVILDTAQDAVHHLLPLRDDFEPALTFRSLFLASCLAAFQAAMSQIYSFKPTSVGVSGTFIVLIAYFAGLAWAKLLPRGDKYEARWREQGGQGTPPRWIQVLSFFNHGHWNLKEHAVCSITATSASNATASITVFTAQDLFYDLPLSSTTVVLSTLSIGLFGYGLCGIFRPIAVWHVESVYWGNIPTVKTLQGLHWADLKSSKPLRTFWYSFTGMFSYEFLPAYIMPWLNSVSIPCLASMKATGDKAEITSGSTSMPLTTQLHSAVGLFICFMAMVGIYYNNVWESRAQPFMSTRLRSASGSAYPVGKVFSGGILNETAFEQYGVPRLTGSFAYAMLMANAAIGALIMHCILFWGKDILRAYKSAQRGNFNDKHHEHMAKHYREAPWWWYAIILVGSFVLGLAVVLSQNITIPSVILLARFGNGIATNNLSKMIAGLTLPGRPIGNMYFAAWSHSVIASCVNLSSDLKLGDYLKIPPRVMFLTQIYGTLIGAVVNYAVMISIVNDNRDLLANTNGNSSWSGASIQSYNTNATSWALAKYLYTAGSRYAVVPFGVLIGAALVVVQRVVVIFAPKVRGFSLDRINLPQLLQYAGFIPYNQSQTCIILSGIIAGVFMQFYLRNYHPRIFKNYSYLVTIISSSWVTDPAGLKKLQDAQVKKVKEYTKTRDEGDLVKICAEEGQVAYDQCKRGSV
ncbi:oligopeptide transporter, putative [Cordyceps militaris CM01]|uniref:Oligopeptide transporter, putative n=1 Tax=Cordyceps militaris (strain CM01) TaxID=983644 RepID=G3JT89_CORMM|nr:oligopeptide transporter, putative [Cordyceps militaris CM01]EGX88236.1 oligopeptide transporter, putative [Cordyceps militaris CM01]